MPKSKTSVCTLIRPKVAVSNAPICMTTIDFDFAWRELDQRQGVLCLKDLTTLISQTLQARGNSLATLDFCIPPKIISKTQNCFKPSFV